ncbi:MAG: phosphotransferase family protein, partial [Streptosporangiaceae bacterium]
TTGLEPLHAGSAQVRRRMGLALAEGIASLGALDHVALGLEGLGKPDNYLERQVARWGAQLESYREHEGWPGPAAIPGVEAVGRWLDEHRPAGFKPGIIHGDYHLANVMYRHDSGELAAIVDWELTTIGDPLLDLGWLLATWPDEDSAAIAGPLGVAGGLATTDELVEVYARDTARDLSAIHWYAVLACFKLGIVLEGTHARAFAGKAPKEVGDLLHSITVGLFERAEGFRSARP